MWAVPSFCLFTYSSASASQHHMPLMTKSRQTLHIPSTLPQFLVNDHDIGSMLNYMYMNVLYLLS